MAFPVGAMQFDKTSVIPDEAKHTLMELEVVGMAGPDMLDKSVVQVSVTDSLLAPSTQTTIKIQEPIHTNPLRNLDKFAGKTLKMKFTRPILKLYNIPDTLEVEQVIYRISERIPTTYAYESYNMHACDATLLTNSAKRVSKSWPCTPPSSVVSDILSMCIGAPRVDIESCGPNRLYIAENIHPFQAIAQNADAALYGGNDPCFLHYMTLKNKGTHHFRSLKSLSTNTPRYSFINSEMGENVAYVNPYNILTYQFPCDFDVLSDIENGINLDGSENVSVLGLNSFSSVYQLDGAGINPCGFGGAIYNDTFTNQLTGPEAGTCEVKSEIYMLRRQARLALLDQDKLSLQFVIPFNPDIYSGDVVACVFAHKKNDGTIDEDYGSGNYLVTTVTHTINLNGVGLTTLDCVSRGVGLSG